MEKLKKCLRKVVPLMAVPVIIGAVGFIPGQDAWGTVMSYQSIDLEDHNPGEDRWMYEYRLSDLPMQGFGADWGVQVLFGQNFSQIMPEYTGADWDGAAWDPDYIYGEEPGAFDVLALVDNPDMSDTFSVSFIRDGLAGSCPGAQQFVVYDDYYNTFETGMTTSQAAESAPVPEPATMLLFGSGLVGLAGAARKKSQQWEVV